MIIKCLQCKKYYDDQFRDTLCPHSTFLANDGQNNFKHYPEAYLSEEPLLHGKPGYREYQEWLDKNKIRI